MPLRKALPQDFDALNLRQRIIAIRKNNRSGLRLGTVSFEMRQENGLANQLLQVVWPTDHEWVFIK